MIKENYSSKTVGDKVTLRCLTAVLCAVISVCVSFSSCYEKEDTMIERHTAPEPVMQYEPLTFTVADERFSVVNTRDAMTFTPMMTDTLQSDSSIMILCCQEVHGIDRTRHDSIVLTRGAQMTSISSFGVSAAKYDEGTYTSQPCGSFFFAQAATAGVSTRYGWPLRGLVSFYAYYPYGSSALTPYSTAESTGVPVYTYTAPTAVADQPDVMLAQVTDVPGNTCGSVALAFHHALTALKFKLRNNTTKTVKVSSVSVSGVRNTGRVTSGTALTLSSWSAQAGAATFSLPVSTSVPSGSVAALNGGSTLMMMVPQTLPSGAQISVTTSLGTFSASLSGSWNPGKTMEYTMTKETENVFSITSGSTSYSTNSRASSRTLTIATSLDGDAKDFTVSNNASSWLTATKGGSGTSRTLTISTTDNDGSSRAGTVTLTQAGTGRTVTVSLTQAAPVISFYASPGSVTMNSKAQTQTTTIRSSIDGSALNMSITSNSGSSWLTVTQSGSGASKTLSLQATQNTTGAARTATVTLTQSSTGRTTTVTVTQNIPQYTFTVSSSSLSMSRNGETKTLTVTSTLDDDPQAFSVSNYYDWLTVSQSGSGGSKTLTVTAARNDGNLRTGYVYLTQSGSSKSISISVDQDGAAFSFLAEITDADSYSTYSLPNFSSTQSIVLPASASSYDVESNNRIYVLSVDGTNSLGWTVSADNSFSSFCSYVKHYSASDDYVSGSNGSTRNYIELKPQTNYTGSLRSGRLTLTQATTGNVVYIDVTQMPNQVFYKANRLTRFSSKVSNLNKSNGKVNGYRCLNSSGTVYLYYIDNPFKFIDGTISSMRIPLEYNSSIQGWNEPTYTWFNEDGTEASNGEGGTATFVPEGSSSYISCHDSFLDGYDFSSLSVYDVYRIETAARTVQRVGTITGCDLFVPNHAHEWGNTDVMDYNYLEILNSGGSGLDEYRIASFRFNSLSDGDIVTVTIPRCSEWYHVWDEDAAFTNSNYSWYSPGITRTSLTLYDASGNEADYEYLQYSWNSSSKFRVPGRYSYGPHLAQVTWWEDSYGTKHYFGTTYYNYQELVLPSPTYYTNYNFYE